MTYFEIFKTICVSIFVIVLMIIFLKGLAKYQNKLTGNKNIKIIERASLSQNTTLNIVKIGNKMYLMSSSSNGVAILKEMSEDEIDESSNKIIDMELNSILKNKEEYLKSFKRRVKNEKKDV